MNMPRRGDAGYSLIEVLVAMTIFGLLSTCLMTLMLGTRKSVTDIGQITNVNEESRIAVERMTRELRQAKQIIAVHLPTSPTDLTSMTIWDDWNNNNIQDDNAADAEILTYTYNPTSQQVTVTANDPLGQPVTQPVLSANVTSFVLGFKSSLWQYDTNGDGDTDWTELDACSCPYGNNNHLLDTPELNHIDLVTINISVLSGSHQQTYISKVDLRNLAQS